MISSAPEWHDILARLCAETSLEVSGRIGIPPQRLAGSPSIPSRRAQEFFMRMLNQPGLDRSYDYSHNRSAEVYCFAPTYFRRGFWANQATFEYKARAWPEQDAIHGKCLVSEALFTETYHSQSM